MKIRVLAAAVAAGGCLSTKTGEPGTVKVLMIGNSFWRFVFLLASGQHCRDQQHYNNYAFFKHHYIII